MPADAAPPPGIMKQGRTIVIPRVELGEIPEMNIQIPRIELPATPEIKVVVPKRIKVKPNVRVVTSDGEII